MRLCVCVSVCLCVSVSGFLYVCACGVVIVEGTECEGGKDLENMYERLTIPCRSSSRSSTPSPSPWDSCMASSTWCLMNGLMVGGVVVVVWL